MPKSCCLYSPFALSVLLTLTAPASAAFECPATTPPSGNPSNFAADAVSANDPSVSRSVMTAIDRLREQGLKSGEIVDHLVSAYCSRIGSQAALSDRSKAEQVSQFASNLASFVYRSPKNTQEDILVSVPVPAELYDQLRRAAETAKVSESAWAIGAIKARLAAP